MQSALKSNEWQRIRFFENFKIEIKKEGGGAWGGEVAEIIQTFCRIAPPNKFGPPSLIYWNFKTLRNILLNKAECIEI